MKDTLEVFCYCEKTIILFFLKILLIKHHNMLFYIVLCTIIYSAEKI